MRITIVSGFFLPMPPVSGGATEKSWFNLAREFAAQGHAVTIISRRWRDFPREETVDGIRHLRLPGWDHRKSLLFNLLLDFWWSWRVFFALPDADIVVVNAVALPMWLSRLKPRAGRVVIMTGRMPKGQYRRYHRIDRVLAASSYVQARVLAENPGLAPVSQVWGYPIDWRMLTQASEVKPTGLPEARADEVVLGYVGRIHQEKGLLLLVEALELLQRKPGLPPWRLLMCGPADVARGGSGAAFRGRLLHRLSMAMPADRFHLLDPQFNERSLAGVYRRIGIFCYPSLAAKGETFGVAVAEAMAAGAVPVVSNLACFTDFVRDGANGLVFDHAAPDAAAQLATALERLLRDAAQRTRLAASARADVRRYDYAVYAGSLLADFAQLTDPRKARILRPVSAPYLGQNCTTPYPKSAVLGRWLWLCVQSTLFRWSPRPFHGFRAALLRLFGADITGPVVIFPTARIVFPQNLSLAPRSMVGPHVNLYNLAPIRLETGANVSQHCHLCAGTHDFTQWAMPLVTKPITIGRNAWLGADVFVGPGVTVGELCVVGARSVVVKDLPPMMVCVGSPCRPVKARPAPV